jgi:hypothetical protein
LVRHHLTPACTDFVLSKVTLNLVYALGYKLFLESTTTNLAHMGTFSLLIPDSKAHECCALFPTRPLTNRLPAPGSPEEMDVIFGPVSVGQCRTDGVRVV